MKIIVGRFHEHKYANVMANVFVMYCAKLAVILLKTLKSHKCALQCTLELRKKKSFYYPKAKRTEYSNSTKITTRMPYVVKILIKTILL